MVQCLDSWQTLRSGTPLFLLTEDGIFECQITSFCLYVFFYTTYNRIFVCHHLCPHVTIRSLESNPNLHVTIQSLSFLLPPLRRIFKVPFAVSLMKPPLIIPYLSPKGLNPSPSSRRSNFHIEHVCISQTFNPFHLKLSNVSFSSSQSTSVCSLFRSLYPVCLSVHYSSGTHCLSEDPEKILRKVVGLPSCSVVTGNV